ncbi:MAG: 2-oxo-4-hydroxy-4-carboxy-5-ureidoimidazoline decarboxylase [Ferruginibacter sp.]
MMKFNDFNKLDKTAAAKELFSCCGSDHWVASMMDHFPFATAEEMIDAATHTWYDQCKKTDWLASFDHHPKIGDTKSLQKKFAGDEQSGITQATAETITALLHANKTYENKFGFIFIVCATGKSADEMLRLLNDRINNSEKEELDIAMGEQHKITIIRLQKLMPEENWSFLGVSQLTTHVLDTSIGKPGYNISIRLLHCPEDQWQVMAQGITNKDGRIGDLLPQRKKLIPGIYKLVFVTGNYFFDRDIETFYPEVEIQFMLSDDAHYHVPLLINPFGYSTYRGS